MSNNSQRMDDVIKAANQAAREDHHNMLGSEHLLLGLIAEGGPAAQLLAGVGVTLETVLPVVHRVSGQGLRSPESELPYTLNALMALDWARSLANMDRQDSTEPEHLLRAILMDVNCVATLALLWLDVDIAMLRQSARLASG